MKMLVPLHLILVSYGDFDESCVDHHCFLGKLPHGLLHIWPKDFALPVISDCLFLPMISDAQLYVMNASS